LLAGGKTSPSLPKQEIDNNSVRYDTGNVRTEANPAELIIEFQFIHFFPSILRARHLKSETNE